MFHCFGRDRTIKLGPTASRRPCSPKPAASLPDPNDAGFSSCRAATRFAASRPSVYLPGFLRFDAGVFAQIDATWKARLNIENIFNKGY
jgi:hypothetical protein